MRYKVIGRKYQDYYTKVEATNPNEAYEIAESLETHNWQELITDDVIEPIEVIVDEAEEIQLNKDNDEWPEMDSGILIVGE